MTKKNNGKIFCDVESCQHNNQKNSTCELDSIKVSCTCNHDECDCTENTICDSFKCNN